MEWLKNVIMYLQKCCTISECYTIFREIMTPRTVSSAWELYDMEMTFHFVFLAWHIILEYMRKTFCTSCNNHYWLSDLKKSLLCLRLVQRRIKDNPITDYFEVHKFLLQVSGITGRRFSTGISHGTVLIC